MKASVRLVAVLAALSIMLAGPAGARASDHNAAGHDLLVVRAGAPAYGALTALPVRPGAAARSLPSGLFDRDGRTLYVATPLSFGQGNSTSQVQAIDPRSGRALRSTRVKGYYTTMPGNLVPGALLGDGNGAGGTSASAATPRSDRLAAATGTGTRTGTRLSPRVAPGVPPVDTSAILSTLSYNGRWLALRDATPGAPYTDAVVIDTARMRAVATLRLRGAFGLDAIDDAGTTLYLIEPRAHVGPRAYQVRTYDLRAHHLDAGPLTEPDDPAGVIRGVAYTRAWSPRGDWLYTLYAQPGKGGAFVHALGVAYRRVHCIMLPAALGGTAADGAFTHDALAVSPDGATLYAANPVLGQLVTVRGLPDGRATRVGLGRRAGSPGSMQRASALSRDGGALFVATDSGVWVVDTPAGRMRAVYARGERVTSVALSADGRRLYALEPDRGRAQVLDADGGRVLVNVAVATDPGPAWAIEGVVSDS